MSYSWQKFVNTNYKLHLLFSLCIRLILIAYGIYHDQISEVKYTDIDYSVFTDASRYILNGDSPYLRYTYRYSPLIAICLVPNIILHPSFGKILFSFIDILIALLIRLIVKYTLKEYEYYRQGFKMAKINENASKNVIKHRKKYKQSNKQQISLTKAGQDIKSNIHLYTNLSMLTWLYNPLSIIISTRGNCDSLAVFLVLLTLFLLQCKKYYFLTGLVHGLSIHFRLYPLIYSLTLFMFLSKFSIYTTDDRRKKKINVQAIENISNVKQLKNVANSIIQSSSLSEHKVVVYKDKEKQTIFKKEYLLYLIPNVDQLRLISGCLLSLSFLTYVFYYLFGYTFMYETYIYHFIRKDTRHNFSLYFYLQYLTAWVKNIGIWQKVLIVLPQIVLLLVFSVRYGLNKCSLNFSILTQTIVMVIYNGVLTSQYFVWIMAILPLCLWQIKMPKKTALYLLTIWFAAQGGWLLPAYLLEFHGKNTFLFIWIQSVSFFCANIAILGRLIMYFMSIKEKSV